ncbi:MAG: glycerate kinase [Oscillospiraceae bacterium]|jgi:glycerate kinase|nr:glycerate kinase [Oscillospiraceae bacterium]
MKKCILIPDSFKGTMSSAEVCSIMAEAVRRNFPAAEIHRIPAADGGEGTVDALLTAIGGRKVSVTVKGPYFEDVPSFYGILPDGTAVIEMAAAAGLPLAGSRLQPELATTYGVGQLMASAVKSGCRRIILGLGGSATNDGGCGAAAALGTVFRRTDGTVFTPVGQTLQEIAAIDNSRLQKRLKGIVTIVMCDINNPLCGPQGAAAVFAPQKGADAQTVRMLDCGLAHFAKIVAAETGTEILGLPGAGAAGGMGGGMAALLGASLQSGIEAVLDAVHFDDLLRKTDVVFTGEGRLDSQSLHGKVISGVARRTKATKVPLFAVAGDLLGNPANIYEAGVTAAFSINRLAVPFEQAKKTCRQDLAWTMDSILRLLKYSAR